MMFSKMTKKSDQKKPALPKLKVLDSADFKLVNGGNGTTTRHHAGASAEI